MKVYKVSGASRRSYQIFPVATFDAKKSVRVFSKEDRRTKGSLIFTCTRVYFSETQLAVLYTITVFAKVIYDV